MDNGLKPQIVRATEIDKGISANGFVYWFPCFRRTNYTAYITHFMCVTNQKYYDLNL